jgi:hypothetical protein
MDLWKRLGMKIKKIDNIDKTEQNAKVSIHAPLCPLMKHTRKKFKKHESLKQRRRRRKKHNKEV